MAENIIALTGYIEDGLPELLQANHALIVFYLLCLAVGAVFLGFSLSGISLRRIREISVRQGGMAVCFVLVLFFVLLLAAWVGSRLWETVWSFAGTAVCAGAMVLLSLTRHPSLFPKDSGILFSADRGQRRKASMHFLVLFVVLVCYLAWLVFLFLRIGTWEKADQALVFLFTLAALGAIIYFEELSVKSAFERLETLFDKEYQAELLNYMQIIRSQRHDFNFHMHAVAGMIENRRYEECSQYVLSMVENVEALNSLLPLKNPAVSALINTFAEMAAARGIRLEVQILDDLSSMICTVYEMNTILGNLLKNAMDETEGKDPDLRLVRLLIMRRARRHYVKVSNPCDKLPEEFREIFNAGYTTKQSHEGIGLATVKKITGKYGGTVYVEQEPGIVHFIAKLPVDGGKGYTDRS